MSDGQNVWRFVPIQSGAMFGFVSPFSGQPVRECELGALSFEPDCSATFLVHLVLPAYEARAPRYIYLLSGYGLTPSPNSRPDGSATLQGRAALRTRPKPRTAFVHEVPKTSRILTNLSK